MRSSVQAVAIIIAILLCIDYMTVAQTKALHKRTTKLLEKPSVTLLEEKFDEFIGWRYSPDNNKDAAFKPSEGVLSVNTFGNPKGDWYGSVAEKELDSPLDVSYDDYILTTYLISTDNTDGALGFIWIVLLDEDNTPLVGIYWSDNHHEGAGMASYYPKDPLGNDAFTHSSYLGLYVDGITRGGSSLQAINGKVTLRKKSGQLSLHYNDGPALTTYTFAIRKIATKVKLSILKYRDLTARDMKIDYIKLKKMK